MLSSNALISWTRTSFREEKVLAQSHTAGEWQSWFANQGFLVLSFSSAEHLLTLEELELWWLGKRECHSFTLRNATPSLGRASDLIHCLWTEDILHFQKSDVVLWTPGLPSLGPGPRGGKQGHQLYPKPFLYDGSLSLTAVSSLYKILPIKVMRTEHALFTVIVGFAVEIDNPSWERYERPTLIHSVNCSLLPSGG